MLAAISDQRIARALRVAEGYLELGMLDHADRELGGIKDPGEQTFAYHALKAEVLRAREQWTAALEEFRMCQTERPTDLGVFLGIAWCLKRVDRLLDAIKTMQDAYRSHAQTPVVLYNLSCYHALAGHKQQALSWLARALRMDSQLRRLIARETDFDAIRNEPEFQKLLELSAD